MIARAARKRALSKSRWSLIFLAVRDHPATLPIGRSCPTPLFQKTASCPRAPCCFSGDRRPGAEPRTRQAVAGKEEWAKLRSVLRKGTRDEPFCLLDFFP